MRISGCASQQFAEVGAREFLVVHNHGGEGGFVVTFVATVSRDPSRIRYVTD